MLEGDSNAAYIEYSFHGNPNVMFRITGKFPKARFVSFQAYKTRLQTSVETLVDRDIQPDAGSQNPYLDGVPLDATSRNYTIEVVPQGVVSTAANVVHTAVNRFEQAIEYRIYSPSEGVTLTQDDVPTIEAFDVDTGAPTTCPQWDNYVQPEFPQFILDVVPEKDQFAFQSFGLDLGTNDVIPGYLFAVNKVVGNNIAIVKFKAPTFVNTYTATGDFNSAGNVRYYSLCTENTVIFQTLNCLPDYLAKPDANGYVTVVIGSGADVEAAANAKGYNFLPDTRQSNQTAMQLVYRNLVPDPTFATTSMYQGDYIPQGQLCDAGDFVAGTCGP